MGKVYLSGVVDVTELEPTSPPSIWGPTDPRPSQLPMPGGPGGLPPYIHGPNDPRPSQLPMPGGRPDPGLGFWGPNDPRITQLPMPGGPVSVVLPKDSIAPGVPAVDMILFPPDTATPK